MDITLKQTGIIRRIDDLGRVVIPKELRRELGIKEEDPLELGIHEAGGIKFLTAVPYKPCSAMLKKVASELCICLGQIHGETRCIAIADSEEILSSRNCPESTAGYLQQNLHSLFWRTGNAGESEAWVEETQTEDGLDIYVAPLVKRHNIVGLLIIERTELEDTAVAHTASLISALL